MSAGNASRVQWGPLVEGDVTDEQALSDALATHKPIAVMHFAGQISVPDSVVNPSDNYRINTAGSLNVLTAAAQNGVKNVIFSSTAAVYGTPEVSPIVETAVKKPINPYGHSKLMTEQVLADFEKAHGMHFTALRYFNAAGATPEAGLGYLRPKPFHLVPMTMLAILGKIPPLKVFGTDYPTPDGTAVRDYVHVADLADAHTLALQRLLDGGTSLRLNLGTSKGYSVKQVLDTAKEVTGREVPHTVEGRRAGDPAELVADAARAQSELGWKPTRSDLNRIIADDWAWHSSL
jgi:UDP-glucose-4-epimerase GalE